MSQPLTQERLRELLHYNPDTGKFTWRVRRNSRVPAHSTAGTLSTHHYWRIQVDGHYRFAHRLAFLYVTGVMPAHIDHINGVRLDNRWCNLRAADAHLNAENRRAASVRNKTGLLGVAVEPNGRYRATIFANGKEKNLGRFDTPEQAHAAYLKAKREHHVGCTI